MVRQTDSRYLNMISDFFRSRIASGKPVNPVLVAALVSGLAIVGLFWRSLDYDLLKFDSQQYILVDRAIRVADFEHVASIFKSYFFLNYNPLQRLSYMLDRAAWGVEPGGYRGTNILLHWMAAVCLFGLMADVTRSRAAAAGLAVLFALHPTRVENVVWLAQRKDVLGAAFGFAALWTWRRFRQRRQDGDRPWLLYLAAVFLYWGAVASKAQWVPLVGVMMLLDLHERRTWSVRDAGSYLPFVCLSGIFAFYAVDAQLIEGQKGATVILGPMERLFRPVADLGFYVRKSVFPVGLRPSYMGREVLPPMDVAVGAVFAVGMMYGTWRSFFGRRDLLLGIGWFVAFLSPTLNILPGDFFVTDRYLYIALVGLGFPVAQWAVRKNVRATAWAAAVLAVLMGAATFRYMPVWENDYSLWARGVALQPNDPLALSGLGTELNGLGRYEEAAVYFERARQQRKWFPTLAPQYAKCLAALGRDPEAIFRDGLARFPRSAEMSASFGWFRLDQKKYAEAETLFLEARKKSPTDSVSLGLATLYERTRRPEKALPLIEGLLEKDPFNEDYWNRLGTMREMLGDERGAEAAYLESARLDSSFDLPRYYLARIAFRRGNPMLAATWLESMRKALGGKQMPPEALNLLAAVRRGQGRLPEALGALREALQQENNPRYWLNLAKLRAEAGRDAAQAVENALAGDPGLREVVAGDPLLSAYLKQSSAK